MSCLLRHGRVMVHNPSFSLDWQLVSARVGEAPFGGERILVWDALAIQAPKYGSDWSDSSIRIDIG